MGCIEMYDHWRLDELRKYNQLFFLLSCDPFCFWHCSYVKCKIYIFKVPDNKCRHPWELEKGGGSRCFPKQQNVSRVGRWTDEQKTVSPLDPRQRHLNLHNYKQETTLAIFEAHRPVLWNLLSQWRLSPCIQNQSHHPPKPPPLLVCDWTAVNWRNTVKYCEILSVNWKGGLTEVSRINKEAAWALQSLDEHLTMRII